jgi:hypothetical protein
MRRWDYSVEYKSKGKSIKYLTYRYRRGFFLHPYLLLMAVPREQLINALVLRRTTACAATPYSITIDSREKCESMSVTTTCRIQMTLL